MSLLTLLCFRYNPIYSIYIYPIYPIRYIQFWILYRITACITLICFVSAMSFPVEQKSYKKEQIVILVLQKKQWFVSWLRKKRSESRYILPTKKKVWHCYFYILYKRVRNHSFCVRKVTNCYYFGPPSLPQKSNNSYFFVLQFSVFYVLL